MYNSIYRQIPPYRKGSAVSTWLEKTTHWPRSAANKESLSPGKLFTRTLHEVDHLQSFSCSFPHGDLWSFDAPSCIMGHLDTGYEGSFIVWQPFLDLDQPPDCLLDGKLHILPGPGIQSRWVCHAAVKSRWCGIEPRAFVPARLRSPSTYRGKRHTGTSSHLFLISLTQKVSSRFGI